ncbi:MAG: flippase-like domain-containing protein [Chitinophagaceae bacterium]|nr:flippase-like domain-containing protein [Chitinophagaceae bacterium]
MKRTILTGVKEYLASHPWISVVFKLAITTLCLWYVSHKINWLLTMRLLGSSNKVWLLLAAVLFTFSKLVAAFRLNIYFKNIGVVLPQPNNVRLYWLGMFYNLFLPGGIGGDAYKVILLNRRNLQTVKKLSAAVLLDRISGVAGLAILVAVYYFLIFKGSQYSLWLLLAVLPGLVIYYFFVKKIFYSFISSCWSTLLLGVIVQFLQVLCMYCLMASIQITQHHNEFVLLFLLSSIVAILPFTIGGLGAREVVFLWGSQQFGLNTNESIFISVLFYLITVIISFVGIRWIYKDPLTAETIRAAGPAII